MIQYFKVLKVAIDSSHIYSMLIATALTDTISKGLFILFLLYKYMRKIKKYAIYMYIFD